MYRHHLILVYYSNACRFDSQMQSKAMQNELSACSDIVTSPYSLAGGGEGVWKLV